jgi:hypothetical protein
LYLSITERLLIQNVMSIGDNNHCTGHVPFAHALLHDRRDFDGEGLHVGALQCHSPRHHSE